MSYILGVITCAALVFADQFTKYLAVEKLMPIRTHPFIPGFMEFAYHTNQGAAFGLFQGARWVFLVFAVITLGAMVFFYIRLPRNRVNSIVRGLIAVIAAGAIGNSVDRLRQGYVVDFLNFQFINFPVFNVADICVTCGTVILAVIIIFFYKEEKKVKPADELDHTDNGGE